MKKIIYIITGVSGSGKDTFIEYVDDVSKQSVFTISSVQPIKDWFDKLGLDPTLMRGEAGRKMISDVKEGIAPAGILNNYCMTHVERYFEDCDQHEYPIVFIHIREQEHIESFRKLANKNGYAVRVIKVMRKQANENIPDNDGDNSVIHVNQDYTVHNDGDIEILHTSALAFMSYHYGTLTRLETGEQDA